MNGIVRRRALVGAAVSVVALVIGTAAAPIASAVPGLVPGSTFYVTERTNQGVAKVTVDTAGNVTTTPNFVSGLPGQGPDSLVFDSAGQLLVSNSDVGTISVVDPASGAVITPVLNTTNIPTVADMAIMPGTNDVWAIGYGQQTTLGVVKVDLTTGAVTPMDPAKIDPYGIAITPDGRVYIDTYGGDNLYQLDPNTGAIIGTLNLPGLPDGMTVDPSTGDVWVSCGPQLPNQMGLCDVNVGTLANPTLTLRSFVQTRSFDGIAADGKGHIYEAGYPDTLVQYDIATGTITTLSTTIPSADDVAPVAGPGAPKPATTTITTTQPAAVPAGAVSGADTAVLSGGVAPTGTIQFNLYNNGDPTCAYAPVYSQTVQVNGNGTYTSGAVGLLPSAGTYNWKVSYSGDPQNLPAVDACGVEQTVITPQVLTGHAYGVSLGGLLTVKPTPDTGAIATPVSETVAPPCVANLPSAVLSAKVVCAAVATVGVPEPWNVIKSSAGASVASLGLDLAGLPAISLGAVQASSTTSCAGSSGSTTIASLKIGNTVVLPSPSTVAPNTTIQLGVLTIVLNQQIPITGADRGLTVNAVHITALGGLVNLIVSSAESDITNCPI